jgi:aspartate/methionine/tyrosine aminotransferase
VDAASDYQLTPSLLERNWTSRTSAALLATPSNPTGTLISTEHLAGMADLARGRGGTLMVDEIYHGLVYEGEYTTALAFADDVFVINSFSKYFLMTGWRLGWLIAPAWAIPDLERLAQNLFLAAPTPAQHAALAAFSPAALDELEARKAELRDRRDYLMPALRDRGFVIPTRPQGAFYLYADCSAHSDDSFRFAQALLEQVGVAVTPGLDFGRHQPQRYLRIAYTQPLPRLVEAIARLDRFLA